ncbi:MAG: radical SAM protein, partial [Bacillota bacterium]
MEFKKALHYIRDGDTVRCFLCPHGCVLKPGQTGRCSVRRNKGGVLYSLNYGKVTACNVDPIEKKPLYHFYPGSRILSVGSFGCNLKCGFCQNHAIAHGTPGTVFVSPEGLADRAASAEDNIGIAYTYNEPSIWYEYVLDTARIARERGLKNVLVTNGYIGIKALEQLLPFIDALNIDVKAFSDAYYDSICSGRLSPVLDTVKAAAGRCHVEVT